MIYHENNFVLWLDSIKSKTPTVPSLSVGSSSMSQHSQYQIKANESPANDQSTDKIK